MSNLQLQKDALFPLLQTAFELELATIPPYLTAMLSLKPDVNRVSAHIIHSVVMEEMLHMILVGNLMSSLSGTVMMNADLLPSYPLMMKFEGQAFRDREFSVNLEYFSKQAIDIFLRIEMPASFIEQAQPRFMAAIDIPGLTIGEFYEKLEQQLEQMCADFPESEVFSGDPAAQIDENYYWAGGGKPIVITDLKTAQAAIRTIVDQGEGADGSLADGDQFYFDQPAEVAHFFRFREISFGRHYKSDDNPKDPPTGEEFDVDYTGVYPILTNAKSTDYQNDQHMFDLNQSFNRNYSLMLSQITEAFNGTPDALYIAIVNGMHNLIPLAIEMMSTVIQGDANGRTGAPSFEWVEPSGIDPAT